MNFVHDAPIGPSGLWLITLAVGSGSPLVRGNKAMMGPECACRRDGSAAHLLTLEMVHIGHQEAEKDVR